MDRSRNYTYMLRCGNGSLYVGWTNDLPKRLKAHQAGKGAAYTRTHLPVELAYFEVFGTRTEAMKREAALKKLSHAAKERLAADFPRSLTRFTESAEEDRAPQISKDAEDMETFC